MKVSLAEAIYYVIIFDLFYIAFNFFIFSVVRRTCLASYGNSECGGTHRKGAQWSNKSIRD
jgi:hypothetical protein